ncbi:hypothetical protein NE473_32035, partial [Hungatella sp. SL.1.14]|nr:hypothetical protein [Hungatella sp. SL.1.14]
SCAYVLRFLFSRRAPVRITFGEYDWQIMKRVLLIGLRCYPMTSVSSRSRLQTFFSRNKVSRRSRFKSECSTYVLV